MPAAAAVVGGFIITPAVVVIENQMLALVADGFGNAPEIRRMFGDQKSVRIIAENHSRRVDESALIVNASGILPGIDGDVGRIAPFTVARPVGPADKDRVIGIVQFSRISVFSRDGEQFAQTGIDRVEHLRARPLYRINARAFRRLRKITEAVARNLLRLTDDRPVGGARLRLCAGNERKNENEK